MAANLGASALADVHQEGLDQILHELVSMYSDQQQPLGVPVLDSLLEVFTSRPSRVSVGAQAQSGQASDASLPGVGGLLLHADNENQPRIQLPHLHGDSNPDARSSRGTKRPDTVLEISSSLSAAGKSHLLYYLTALAILPSTYGDLPIGGRHEAVVFIDTDGRFDADRLRTVAREIVRQRVPSDVDNKPSTEDLETLLVSSIQHVHVFRPQSSSTLLATICALDTYLFDLSQHRSASRPLQMIAIDSVTAFFWQDRLREEASRTETIGRPQKEIDGLRESKQLFSLSDLYADLVKELKQLQRRFGCAVVYTATIPGGRPANTNDASGPFEQYMARPSLRPALPAPWGTFPALRLIVHRSQVRPFPPGINTQDAEREAPLRQSVVDQGKFSACVNAWGSEEWPRRVVDGIAARKGGRFAYFVRETGVELPLS
ncbi:hypothetical protein N7474_003654 [Penicillium riverlandense]|uniref:uncharacterized protein n=1 Tax=Penicillium riverlandense TaxID=1903569 RepID=UPI002546FD03|nr:uncharacterized protein N7474_003654 [Penicillium riverlandense]KAJ5818063.1 hypothetical protein N7474_003654 [Penicillium riverlandense]